MVQTHTHSFGFFFIVCRLIAFLSVPVASAVIAQVPDGPFAGSPRSTSSISNSDSSSTSLFLPVFTYDSGGVGPVSLAVGDVNNDDKPDIVVGNYCLKSSCNGSYVSVLLSNGDGTFQTPVSYSTGGVNPWAVAIGDVNADGRPDLIVANLCESSANCNNGTIAVLLGNGDGSFRAPTIYNAGGYWNFSVVIADVNGDGIPDLLVGNYLQCSTCTEGAVSVFIGNGDGSFQVPAKYDSAGYEVYGVAVGDLNGDGKPDIVVTNNCQSSAACPGPGGVSVLLGNGDGTFKAAVPYSSGGYWGPDQVVIVDLNGDGIPDLVVSNYCQSGSNCPGPGDVAVLLGNGDGTFKAPVSYPSGGYHVFLVAVGDINRDGHPDVVVANECDSASCTHGTAGVLLGNGDGTFQAAQTYSSGGSIPYKVVIADVNGDGKPDVIMANANSQTVGVLLNNVQTPASTSLASSLNPSVYGQTVEVTATVTSDSGMPTGTVQILNGTTVVGSGTLASGSVSIPVSTLPAGTDSIIASYLGGGGFAPSKSSPITQTVTKAPTATLLASSLNPVGTNQAVTFTATVSSHYGGAATDAVTFMAGAQNLGSAALRGNIASLTTSFATAGTYSIMAQYNGDSNNTSSTSGALSEKIIASTTTSVTSSLNPSVVGQTVTFTATVTSSAGIPPNGEIIAFYNGSAMLGTAPLSGGTAMLTTSALPAGVFTITARYPGDSTFAASTSLGLRQTVNATSKSATATTLASSLNPSIYGQKVTLMAQVTTSGPVPPTGTVVFMWRYFTQSYTIGTATLNNAGVATLTKSNLNADQYAMTAVYLSDTNNLSSTSAVLNQTVLQTTSAAALTSSVNPLKVGQAITFTAKITSPTVMPSGPVTFKAGTTVLGTAQLSSGKAIFTTSTLPAGSVVVKVTYNGDSNIKGSSVSVTQTVQP